MIFSNQLTERVHFYDVKSNKRALKSANTSVVYYLLLWAHIVKSCQIYDIANLCKVEEGINKPTGADCTGKLNWLRSVSIGSIWQRKYFNLLARLKFFLNDSVLLVAVFAVSVCKAIENFIVKV